MTCLGGNRCPFNSLNKVIFMDDVVKDFLVESYENLDRMDRDFVELEKNPSKETLGSIFRAVHTIKGTCGFLGFSKLESVAHAGESLMSLLRDGALQVNQPITDALLAMVDAVREMLASIEATESEGERDDSALIETLHALQSGEANASPAEAPQTTPESPSAAPSVALENMSIDDLERLLDERAKSVSQPAPEAKLGELLVQKGETTAEQVEQALAQQSNGDPRRIGEILVQQGAVKPAAVLETIQAQGEVKTAVSDSTIRVDVGLLDKLMNLVGELVLARNQILQYTSTQEDSAFVATSQRLNLITTELQENVMKTRMQPIGNLWSKLPRVVRDLANACGKQVRVEMEGKETELDKTLIEAIKDPLTHMVRNSVDHGVESPEVRAANGKAAEGVLSLKAYHEGGQVNIEITDDGAGLDPERIKEKALQKGLISSEHAARMGEREMINLIFMPGFSTAEKVTNVSGRGVGMDVVKTNIEKIGGTVDVQSKKGQGTTLKIKIPLTLAIIPALVVTSSGDWYAIPQVNLLELVRLEGAQAQKGIETIHGAPVHRLRGNLLPLVYLNSELKVSARRTADGASRPTSEHQTINIVVLQADDRQFGLVVDEINDTEEIVVKPLGKQLKGVTGYSGATIMGDGSVALILDVLGIAQRARVVSEVRERALVDKLEALQEESKRRRSFMLFEVGKNGRLVMPLSMVERLEEFPRNEVERSGGQEVVQYRGEIMPLINLQEVLGYAACEITDDSSPLQVLVYSEQGRCVGMVVERILDIVEEAVAVERKVQRKGISGSLVVQDRVTDLLDVSGFIGDYQPALVEKTAMAEGAR
jgi:two-component system chemotaxis sensor kinase CheA